MSIVLPNICQQTDSHCGPAVMELLFAHQGIIVSQEEIVRAAQAKGRLIKYGIRPDHMARAVAKLAPSLQFWFKQHATIRDLEVLTREYHTPVGISWQGLFYDTLEEEKLDFPSENLYGDHGHYSVAIDLNRKKNSIVIADTYSEYYQKPRSFTYAWFKTRWWDFACETNQKTKLKYGLRIERMLFIVAPVHAYFPEALHMKQAKDLPKLQLLDLPQLNTEGHTSYRLSDR